MTSDRDDLVTNLSPGGGAGTVAHDLDNLLTAIQFDLRQARQRSDAPEVRALIARALHATETGAALVRSLLDADERCEPVPEPVGLDLPQTDRRPPTDEIPQGNGELILLVVHDRVARETLLKRLEVIGFAVIDATDPGMALELLEAGEPVDLVICETVCPGGMSGFELVAELQRLYPHIGRLLLSMALAPHRPATPVLTDQAEILAEPATLGPLSLAIRRALLRRGVEGLVAG
jgi:CheY-like chemotaxis protein